MLYRCSYDDCSFFEIPREIEDGGEVLAADDSRRACGGTVNVGSEQEGWTQRPCLRLLDALDPDGTVADHVEMELPAVPVAPVQEQQQPTAADVLLEAPAPPTTGQIVDAVGQLDPATATVAELIAAITGAAQPVAVVPEPVQTAPPIV